MLASRNQIQLLKRATRITSSQLPLSTSGRANASVIHAAAIPKVEAKRPGSTSVEVKLSNLSNGLHVSSVDLRGPVAQLAVVFRAGARYESLPDEQGITHHIRNAVGLDSKSYLGVQLLWEFGTAGVNLVASTSRDLFTVHVSVLRDQASRVLSILGEVAAQPAFKPWEIVDNAATLWADRALLCTQPEDELNDMLHAAAYRTGALGNSLYAHDFNIGRFNHKALTKFAGARLLTGECAIVGINVDHDTLLHYATDQAPVTRGNGTAAAPSPFRGGEVRKSTKSSLVHVAIAGAGAGLSDARATAVQAVLSELIGSGPAVKYANGGGVSGLVSTAVFKASNGFPFGFSSVNAVHADTGLVGVYLLTQADKAAPLVKSAVKAFRQIANASIDETTLKRAKQIAIVNILLRSECSSNLMHDLCAQTLATKSPLSPSEFAKLIDSVTANDVKQAAAKATSKLAIAALGDIHDVPYLDEL